MFIVLTEADIADFTKEKEEVKPKLALHKYWSKKLGRFVIQLCPNDRDDIYHRALSDEDRKSFCYQTRNSRFRTDTGRCGVDTRDWPTYKHWEEFITNK